MQAQTEMTALKDETLNPTPTEEQLRLELEATSGSDKVQVAEKLVALKRTVVDQRIVSLSLAYREYYDTMMEMFQIVNSQKP